MGRIRPTGHQLIITAVFLGNKSALTHYAAEATNVSMPDILKKKVCAGAHLAPVEVLDDGVMEELLSLPLALHGVVEELPQRPVGPLQQLVVQQQSVRRLCDKHTTKALKSRHTGVGLKLFLK